jgi:hypothetical protein
MKKDKFFVYDSNSIAFIETPIDNIKRGNIFYHVCWNGDLDFSEDPIRIATDDSIIRDGYLPAIPCRPLSGLIVGYVINHKKKE